MKVCMPNSWFWCMSKAWIRASQDLKRVRSQHDLGLQIASETNKGLPAHYYYYYYYSTIVKPWANSWKHINFGNKKKYIQRACYQRQYVVFSATLRGFLNFIERLGAWRKESLFHWWGAFYAFLFTRGYFKLHLLLFNFQIESLTCYLAYNA